MAKGREPLRIPQSWKDQARAFVIQLERILDKLFNRTEANDARIEQNAKRIEEVDESKLPLSGGTVTGNILLQQNNVDASKADNNITTTIWPTTHCVLDKDNRIIERSEAVVSPTGGIGHYSYVRNYDTDGNQVAQKGIAFHMNKSGALTWSVDDASDFRRAIAVPPASQFNDSITNLNTPLTDGKSEITFNKFLYNASNNPTTSRGFVITLWSDTYRQQVLFGWFGEIYTRYYSSGNISPWKQVASPTDTDVTYIKKDGNNSYMAYKVIGKMVHVFIYHKVSSGTIAAWGAYSFTTNFPSEYRPKVDCAVRCVSDRASSEGCCVMMTTSGGVYINGRYTGASDTSDILQASLSYPI